MQHCSSHNTERVQELKTIWILIIVSLNRCIIFCMLETSIYVFSGRSDAIDVVFLDNITYFSVDLRNKFLTSLTIPFWRSYKDVSFFWFQSYMMILMMRSVSFNLNTQNTSELCVSLSWSYKLDYLVIVDSIFFIFLWPCLYVGNIKKNTSPILSLLITHSINTYHPSSPYLSSPPSLLTNQSISALLTTHSIPTYHPLCISIFSGVFGSTRQYRGSFIVTSTSRNGSHQNCFTYIHLGETVVIRNVCRFHRSSRLICGVSLSIGPNYSCSRRNIIIIWT